MFEELTISISRVLHVHVIESQILKQSLICLRCRLIKSVLDEVLVL